MHNPQGCVLQSYQPFPSVLIEPNGMEKTAFVMSSVKFCVLLSQISNMLKQGRKNILSAHHLLKINFNLEVYWLANMFLLRIRVNSSLSVLSERSKAG
jgi:hypothetical protein